MIYYSPGDLWVNPENGDVWLKYPNHWEYQGKEEDVMGDAPQRTGEIRPSVFMKGEYYRIRYQQQAANYQWMHFEATMKFLGLDGRKSQPGNPMYQFDLRPIAGTQELEHRNLTEVTHVINELAVPKAPRKLRKDEIR